MTKSKNENLAELDLNIVKIENAFITVPQLNLVDTQERKGLAKQFYRWKRFFVRSGKFKRELQSSLGLYRKILVELQDRDMRVIVTMYVR